MALPSSGPLSMNDIAGEFGGSTPHALNEYYAGGGLVPAGTSGTYGAVPSSGTISIQNFYGTSNFVPIYIEEVFQTWLYTGNNSTNTITNGINLSANGGLVWMKGRGAFAENHNLIDTARGVTKSVSSNNSDAQLTNTGAFSSFNTNGFTLGPVNAIEINSNGRPYVSWTFRKQPKFFDVVTYTGNGSANQTINHNLGSAPGCMIVKCTSAPGDWFVYHVSLGNDKDIFLNTTAARRAGVVTWNNFTPTSTQFQVTSASGLNTSAATYVAYIFANNAGGFGATGTDNVITCGTFTFGVSGDVTVNLGWEPQWVLVKRTDGAGPWWLADTMRGWAAQVGTGNLSSSTGGKLLALFANASDSEQDYDYGGLTSTGFKWPSNFNAGTGTTNYIYIAIRRGPMKTPTTGTSVFSPNTWTSGTGSAISTNFPVDMQIARWLGSGDNNLVQTRLPGVNTTTTNSSQPRLITNSTAGEAVAADNNYGYNNTGFLVGSNYGGNGWAVNFRRAPGFFDVVCYTGVGSAQSVSHNLTVAPELIIWKTRNVANNWVVGFNFTATTSQGAFLDLANAAFTRTYPTGEVTTRPTATTVTMGNNNTWELNSSYVMYLFATCPGVSKVGSYTGTGAAQTINCGFTSGARFVLVKRTDTSGGWWLYDSARGISSGNDPYLLLNTTAAQITNTNYLDTVSTGFQLTTASGAVAELNANGGTYLFLAIA